MDNLETPTTLSTRATWTRTDGKTTTKRKNKAKNKKQTNKNWKDEQHEPTKNRHVSHIVKDGTNSLDNGGNKNIYVKGKRSIIPGT